MNLTAMHIQQLLGLYHVCYYIVHFCTQC